MPKLMIAPTTGLMDVVTVKFGTSGQIYTDKDVGKAVKLAADSRFVLCAAGDAIEGVISSVELGTNDGFSWGGVAEGEGYVTVTFDGSQAAGTGTIAVGDYVLCGTVTALNTAGALKVCKATDQAAAKAGPYRARVVSLGSSGTGAVGTTGTVKLF